MTTPNKQHDKSDTGVKQNANHQQRPGTNPQQPNSDDYDYRPDFGKSGGGADHNPDLKTDTVQNPSPKPLDKPKRGK